MIGASGTHIAQNGVRKLVGHWALGERNGKSMRPIPEPHEPQGLPTDVPLLGPEGEF